MNFKPIPFQTYGSICGGQTAMQDGLNCISNQNNEINNNNLAHTGYHTSETTGGQTGGKVVRMYGKPRRTRRMYGGSSNQTTCPQPPHVLQGASAVNPLNTMCSGQQNLVNAKVQGMYDADVEYPFKSISQSGGKKHKQNVIKSKRNRKRTNKRTNKRINKRTNKRTNKRNKRNSKTKSKRKTKRTKRINKKQKRHTK